MPVQRFAPDKIVLFGSWDLATTNFMLASALAQAGFMVALPVHRGEAFARVVEFFRRRLLD